MQIAMSDHGTEKAKMKAIKQHLLLKIDI